MLNKAMSKGTDPHLQKIIQYLKENHRCHSAILYGSRARGEAGAVSDYDVVGVIKRGSKTRVAKKVDGVYWDLFIFPEKDLKKLGPPQFSWRDAKVLFEEKDYGRRLVARIQKAVKPFKPEPQYELDVTRAWAEKQLERIAQKDVQGFYRRAEFQIAALEHYFQLNRMQYWGPKAGLQWLKENDPKTYKLFAEVYKKPADMKSLKALVKRVYQVSL